MLTGITDDDVRKTIDLDRLERRLASADVLVAHNCAFDSARIGSLLPGIADAAWACSANDFDWPSQGFDGASCSICLCRPVGSPMRTARWLTSSP